MDSVKYVCSCPLMKFIIVIVLLEVIITTSGVFKVVRYHFFTLLLQTNKKCTSGVYLLYKIFIWWSFVNHNRTLGLLSYCVHATSFIINEGKKIIHFNKCTIDTNTELFALKVFNSLNRTSSLKSLVYQPTLVALFWNWKKKQLESQKTAHSCLFRSQTWFYFLINK